MKKININFKEFIKKAQKINDQKVKLFVGWLDEEMSEIAAVHEYGATIPVTATKEVVIPPRPHRQQALDVYQNQWVKDLRKLLLANKFNAKTSLTQLGLKMAEDYRTIIKTGTFKDLAEVTLKAREYNNISGTQPLYATGEMARQITSEVTEND